jgi:hypothetical protein
VLSGFWSAGGLTSTIPEHLGNYDAMSLEPLLPPIVATGADGALRLTMPDLILHLTSAGDELTTVALTVDAQLQVLPHPSAPNFVTVALGTPTLRADVMHDLTGMPPAGLEALMPRLALQMTEHVHAAPRRGAAAGAAGWPARREPARRHRPELPRRER